MLQITSFALTCRFWKFLKNQWLLNPKNQLLFWEFHFLTTENPSLKFSGEEHFIALGGYPPPHGFNTGQMCQLKVEFSYISILDNLTTFSTHNFQFNKWHVIWTQLEIEGNVGIYFSNAWKIFNWSFINKSVFK